MASDTPQSALSASLTAVEANVIIAGVEAVTVCWVLYRANLDQCLIPDVAPEWHWSLAFYAIGGLLGIVIAGLALEGVAGLMESLITHPLWGRARKDPWKWYSNFTKIPDSSNSAKAQKWIWKSAQAYQDFSRRRLRILVARNTAMAIFLLTIGWLVVVPHSFWPVVLGFLAFALFVWLWLDAQKGWNVAVNRVNELGEP